MKRGRKENKSRVEGVELKGSKRRADLPIFYLLLCHGRCPYIYVKGHKRAVALAIAAALPLLFPPR
jgi:hypothetical protein